MRNKIMSNLVEFAKRELEAAKLFNDDGDFYGGMTGTAVLELIEKFSEQGHSGMSAPITVSIFEKLAKFQPLSPLTGSDDEWGEVANGIFQNNRCSHVFKQADRFDGQAYDIQAKVFREPNGSCYTNTESHVPIEFPYTPAIEYIDVPEEESE